MLKKSVMIAGRHSTSISIEEEFFIELQQICQERGLSVNQLVTEIDRSRIQKNNLSSAIRLYVLHYLKNKIKA